MGVRVSIEVMKCLVAEADERGGEGRSFRIDWPRCRLLQVDRPIDRSSLCVYVRVCGIVDQAGG